MEKSRFSSENQVFLALSGDGVGKDRMALYKVFNAVADLQETPGKTVAIGRRDSQMLRGEPFDLLALDNGARDQTGPWAFGRSLLDGYEGWVPLQALQPACPVTHAVTAFMTHAYTAPDFKTKPADLFSFMTRLSVDETRQQNGFVALKDSPYWWVRSAHLMKLSDLAANPADIVETATMFSGVPYRYGGRSAFGVDCSGVVQLALQRNGIFCPRDTDQQMPVLGTAVAPSEVRRGDIVYFPGHVGIMVDRKNIFNATARHMQGLVEPLSVLKAAYKPDKGPAIIGVRRLIP